MARTQLQLGAVGDAPTLKKNGRPLKNDSVHIWTFNDKGRVKRYQHFNDTALELAAWKA